MQLFDAVEIKMHLWFITKYKWSLTNRYLIMGFLIVIFILPLFSIAKGSIIAFFIFLECLAKILM